MARPGNSDTWNREEEEAAPLPAGDTTWRPLDPQGTVPTGLVDAGSAPPAAGLRVADRYCLRSLLGTGGYGEVWRALDELTGVDVAVKLLYGEGGPRALREVAALRLLQLPGVVRLLDDGRHEGHPFIVMELVEGEPFPLGPIPWARIAPIALRLLEALQRVHSVGIVHRDLKPANVLVDAAGAVVLLDFGIARGAPLGTTITRHLTVGTPMYLAPEQIGGGPVDARADLYAVGVMLFEALSGAAPLADRGVQELLAAKLVRPAPPIRSRVPALDPAVAAVIDAMLAIEPHRRPSSAEGALGSMGLGTVGPLLPWLGPDDAIRDVVGAVRGGRSVSVWGPSGAGRSRFLDEVAVRLRALGLDVARTRPGERPLASLSDMLGAPGTADGEFRRMEEALRARLAAGTVLVVDDLPLVDRWTRALLDRCGGAGVFVVLREDEHAVRVAPLAEEVLRALFWGPDPILHLREDGARLLHERTGGFPARIVSELASWVGSGLARWEDGRLRINRVSLDRLSFSPPGGMPLTSSAGGLDAPLDELLSWIALAGPTTSQVLERATGLPTWELDVEIGELLDRAAVRRDVGGQLEAAIQPFGLTAWPEERRLAAHRALAAALPPGAPGRFLHLAAAGDVAPLVDEALHLARFLLPVGATGRAIGVLTLALSRLGSTGGFRADGVAGELAHAALGDGSVPELRAAAHLIRRSRATIRGLPELLEATALAEGGLLPQAASVAASIPRIADPTLDAHREVVLVRDALARDPAEAEQRIARYRRRDDDGQLARQRKGWLGHVRMAQGRHAEAAKLHREAADGEPALHRRIGALVNAGRALREAGELESARSTFEEARIQAAEARLPTFEAHAIVALRGVEYRLGIDSGPDIELVEAVAALRAPWIEATACFNEAAAAWRLGDLEVARALGSRSGLLWGSLGRGVPATVAVALSIRCGDPAGGPSRAELEAFDTPELRVEVCALLAERCPEARAVGREALLVSSPGRPGHRGVLLTPEECVDLLQ